MLSLWNHHRIGLLFDDRGITAAEVGANGRTIATARIDFDDAINLNAPAILGKQLRATLKQNNFHGRDVVIGLPADWIITRRQPAPPLQGHELAQAIHLTVPRCFSADADELCVEFVPPAVGQADSRILMLAILRKRVRQLQLVTESAGLRIHAVTSTIAALAITGGSETPQLVAHVTATGIELAMYEHQRLRLLRHISASTSDEIRRALASEAIDDPLERAQRIIIWSADETLPGVAALRELGLPVEPAAITESPAAAVASMSADLNDQKIDFLNSRLVEPPKTWFDQRARIAAILLAGVALGVGALGWCVFDQYSRVQQLETRLQDMQPDLGAARQLLDTVDYARQWFDNRPHTLDYLKALTLAFPDTGDVWATEFNMRNDQSDVVTGRAADSRAVMQLRDQLQRNPAFRNVKLLYLRETGWGDDQITFSMSLEVQPQLIADIPYTAPATADNSGRSADGSAQ